MCTVLQLIFVVIKKGNTLGFPSFRKASLKDTEDILYIYIYMSLNAIQYIYIYIYSYITHVVFT